MVRPSARRFVALFTVFLVGSTGVQARAPQAPQAPAGPRSVVVDQTGLPLPGVRIDVHRGDQIIESLVTGPDGTFVLGPGEPRDMVEAALEGFETLRVPRPESARIVLPIGHANEVTEVVASALTSSGSAMEHLGSSMAAPLAQKLPTPRPHILQALPLLPSVVRGRDGLLRIGGTRPHESSLWVDGFDVTDPVTGTTGIDLPDESVKGMGVVRDPISATFNNVLGSMASIETTTGGDTFKAGVQGFIPRPRINRQYGVGHIEAFFPRAYASGPLSPRAHYFVSTEVNFERVPVPGVTTSSGNPASGATGMITFGRIDFSVSKRQSLTVEGLFMPGSTNYAGLSPLQQPEASPDISSRDIFAGFVDRIILGESQLLTVRIGYMAHGTAIGATGSGPALLSPTGFSQNWFTTVDTWATRRSASVTWDRAGLEAAGAHTVSLSVGIQQRSMTGSLAHEPLKILDDASRLMRLITFEPVNHPLEADDTSGGVGARDLWDITARLQVDLNLRVDATRGSVEASPRVGVRYLLDPAGRTTLKASVGRFVGLAPLGALAFAHYPARNDVSFDPISGAPINALTYQPATMELQLPRADGMSLQIEQRVGPRLELQASVRQRKGSLLPTLEVPVDGGQVLLDSNGHSTYREFQFSARQTWSNDTQLFVSYVRASSVGELNDFGTLFTRLSTPLYEPGGMAPTPSEVPNRIRGWATVALPRRIVVSPAVEWRDGFPYSLQDIYRHYLGDPNSRRFPDYFSLDVTTFKTFDVFKRKMDLGLQVFNITNHFNPRDVITVVPSTHFGELTNSLGLTLAGYMQIRW